jgi:hypothetical protein
MPLTRSFKEFVKSRIERDAKFRQALFQEAVQTLIEGDVDTAKAVLRDYINATIGFPALAKATGTPPKSLMRMFGRSAASASAEAETALLWRLTRFLDANRFPLRSKTL